MAYSNHHNFVLQDDLQMKDAGLVAASAAAQVGGSNKIHDLGAAVYQKGALVIDATAIEVASNDELFSIEVQGSSSATFASDINVLAEKQLGALEVTGNSADSPTGRYVVYFDNVADDGQPVRYLRVYTRVAGTVATGVNYSAWLVKD